MMIFSSVLIAFTFIFNFFSSSPAVSSDPAMIKINQQPWYSQSHHNKEDETFINIWGEEERPGTFKLLNWVVSSMFFSSEAYKLPPFQSINPDVLKKENDSIRVTWIGHATALVQMSGQNIITDPMFSDRASPVSFSGPKRLVVLPITIEKLPSIDVVIISHSHYDHCDEASLKELNQKFKPLFIVPLKMKSLLNEWDITNVIELDWWQYADFNGIRYHSTPARHRSNRGVLDVNEILWSSWMIEEKDSGRKVYFGGDTGYSAHFKEIGEKLGTPDVALLPIGAYLPRWLMQYNHVTPDQSVQAFVDLGAKYMVGIHWGTFDLADEPFDEPGRIVPEIVKEKSISSERVKILPIGGMVNF